MATLARITVGNCPDSWGVWFASDPKQTPWTRFLDEVAEAGFEYIETGPIGYLPSHAPTLHRELAARGLSAVATMIEAELHTADAWEVLVPLLNRAGELLTKLGAQFIGLIGASYMDLQTGKPTGPQRLGEEAWSHLIDTCNLAGEHVGERFGLRLVFHPHADTHVEYTDQMERFLEESNPASVAMVLDVGHHAYRGGDPIEFMRRHHGRIPYLHIKNVDAAVCARVEREGIPMVRAVEMGAFVEPEKGVVSYPRFLETLRKLGYSGYAIVEQDMYPAPSDRPLPIARRTREYLRRIGFG